MGGMLRCAILKTEGTLSPVLPTRGKNKHDIDIFWPSSPALQPLSLLPTPLWSPCCPVDGRRGPLKKGFMASFYTSEKPGAVVCLIELPSWAVWHGTEMGFHLSRAGSAGC